MTSRNFTVSKTVLAMVAVVAIVSVPWASAMAETTIEQHRNASGGFAAKDGTEHLGIENEAGIAPVRSYARSNYMWPYSDGPSYPAVDVSQKDVVWTPAGTFRLSDLPVAAELRTAVKLGAQGGQYFVVQYDDEVVRDERDLTSIIEANGGRFVFSPNSGSLVAWLTHAAHSALNAASGFLVSEPYHAAFKLEPTIGRTPLQDPIKALADVYTLEVVLWPGEQVEPVAAAVASLGGTVLHMSTDTLTVELHRTLLPQLADIDAVQVVHERLPLLLHGEETSTILQSARVPTTGPVQSDPVPYHDAGITGKGLNVCAFNLTTPCTIATQAAACAAGGANTKCLGEQILMVLDSGFSLDAGDLSNTRTIAGTASPTHRKVRVHESTNQFGGGGAGDTSGCDSPAQGGFTHGHVVSATALGNATNVTMTYGTGWNVFDTQGNAWEIDGVAYQGALVAYDGQVTPPNGSCSDPGQDGILAGDLYATAVAGACPGINCPGSLGVSYVTHGARVTNFSWGSQSNTYSTGAGDVDQFMVDKKDALVFISAGNYGVDNVPAGGDSIPDVLTLGSPATTKNGLAIGASRNAGSNFQESRAGFSSVGPAINTTTNRIAPQLMAPGSDIGNPIGESSEYACRSNDNDQSNPVLCDESTGASGTSFSSPAAAGAGMLVRDYFRQGFYPNATQQTAKSKEIGAAALKAVLFASADFMSGAGLSRAHRWNNEQGYGRIQLDRALPLESWAPSPLGMLINDPFSSTADLGLPFTINTGGSVSTTFQNVNDDKELRIALVWIDPVSQAGLRNDINLKVISPSGIEYRGNYFTDDNNQDNIPQTTEDCGGIGAENNNAGDGLIDQNQWSLPVCTNSGLLGKSNAVRAFDQTNPSEAIFLSPDPQGDNATTMGNEGLCSVDDVTSCENNLDCQPGNGVCVNDGDYKQTELGTWTINVFAGPGTFLAAQEFSVVVVGGVSLGSTARFDKGDYTCNERTVISVTEVLDVGTFGTDNPNATAVSNRTTVQVIDGDPDSPTFDTVVDSESGLVFTQEAGTLKFESDPLQLTAFTARQPGNGVLDVRDVDTIRVLYTDADTDTAGLPLTITRSNSAAIDCRVDIGFGSIVFAQFGQDSGLLLQGGCERNVRGEFFFGFPDRTMDADESVILAFAFNSSEPEDLQSVVATLSCVQIDCDSPVECLPSGAGCDAAVCNACPGTPSCDPRRENNPACVELEILDPENFLGFVPAGAAMSANFAIQVAGDGNGDPFEGTRCENGTTPCDVSTQATNCSGIGSATCSLGQPTPTVELILQIEASVSGQTRAGLAVARQKMNVDTNTIFYSTDYPAGGTEVVDHGPGQAGNNDEIASNPITELGNFQTNDYRFETFNFSSLTSTGKNLSLLSPWNFDGNNGGFKVGLAAPADQNAANGFLIANWGEDKNFNNIEDGICQSAPAIACYDFGFNTDPRCPPNTVCGTVENNAGGAFTQNWNTKGGCGWQTRGTGECTLDATRGCLNDSDCLGTCRVANNDIASTFTPCGSGQPACPFAKACSETTPNPNPLSPCMTDADCGNVATACEDFTQTCNGQAGTCGAVMGAHTGGVWHTGQIGDLGAACSGAAGSACANYKVITAGGGQLLWWELLTTPVMQKVDQTIGGDGLPNATIEIVDWGWNSNVNLSDPNVAYTWELDTDLSKLDPVDLFSDSTILGLADGGYGAIALGSNPELTNGWPVYGPQCRCTNAPLGPCASVFDCAPGVCTATVIPCHVAADCNPGGCTGPAPIESCFSSGDCPAAQTCTNPVPQGCAGAPTCGCASGNSENGILGNSRVGDAGCFFEGNILPATMLDLGLVQPKDDDRNQDPGNDALIDEFVQDDGPYRNIDVVSFNGQDMRFGTLEDIFGDTGNTFQAALGFVNFEGTPQSLATQSYGLAVDDMVVKWKEFTLDPDETDCGTSGSCAVIELSQGTVFEGQSVLLITVLEAVPDPINDCDLDGTLDGTNNCNGINGPDVVVKATSEADVDGNIVFLDQVAGSEYKGSLAISALADGPGVLFVAQQGSEFPTVTVTYKDNDIDPTATVEKCPNDVDPTKHGNITATSTVLLGSFCDVTVVQSYLTDDNDGDRFADTNETVTHQVCLLNNCGVDLHNCTGRLFSTGGNVDCVKDGVIDIGTLLDSPDPTCVTDEFSWRTSALRTTVGQNLNASFKFTMTCDEIDALQNEQLITLPLDLNLDAAGQSSVAWSDGFEVAGLPSAKFIAENLDAGIPGANNTEGLLNGDDWRCQYTDPDWPNANSYGNAAALDCYPAQTLASANAIHWRIDGTGQGAPDGGRAKTGSRSLYYGIYLSAESEFTTPMAVVESVRTANPINLGVNFPELNWWHQASLVDGRFIAMPDLRSGDRGVVQYKTVDNGGVDTSTWITLQPFSNKYDTQAYDFFFNCMFDPVDDGTTEDDFFDDSDPERRLGPSSTCHPEFNYSCMGDTNQAFQVTNICNANVQPGPTDAGILGTGTWVRSKVDLFNLAGRRVKLRFLVTSIKASSETHDGQFAAINPGEWDNGWWLDDVTVTESLTDPANLVVDLAGFGGTPCGPICTSVTAVLVTDPDANGGAAAEELAAPGQPIELDASGSTGTCLNGVLQYRFEKDGQVVRDYSENPILLDAPAGAASYDVLVRCSTATTCAGTAGVDVTVNCPAGPTPLLGNWCSDGLCNAADANALKADATGANFTWGTATGYQVLTGPLSGVSSYAGTVTSGTGTSVGSGALNSYTVLREKGPLCNEVGSWSSGGSQECGGTATCDRDSDITP